MEPMDDHIGDSNPPNSMENVDWANRWSDVCKILDRSGPLSRPEFEEGNFNAVRMECKILVIGAGGLGCELLKNLAMMGFIHIDVIDMDTIELSNLNRQFLFREKDIGRPKAEVAAEFINKRVPGALVNPHFNKIEDYDMDFYEQFSIIVCGLDAIAPRRWMNNMLTSMLDYSEDGTLKPESVHPLIDGGTEGFKGNARVIAPGMSSCVECTLGFYPPALNFPMCTLAQTPRLPEHCIEFVKIVSWPKEKPFGDSAIDGDNPEHIQWLHEKSLERAAEFKISGVTYRLTQGVVKRIIPAVASTNAVIAAICANEVFKIAYCCYPHLKTYVVFNDTLGIYTNTLDPEKLEHCLACSVTPRTLRFPSSATLEEVLEFLKESPEYQMVSPGARAVIKGAQRTLYIPGLPSLEIQTRPNLKKTLQELEFVDGQQMFVSDRSSPTGFNFIVRFEVKN